MGVDKSAIRARGFALSSFSVAHHLELHCFPPGQIDTANGTAHWGVHGRYHLHSGTHQNPPELCHLSLMAVLSHQLSSQHHK